MNVENELEQYYELTHSIDPNRDPNTIYINQNGDLYAGNDKLVYDLNTHRLKRKDNKEILDKLDKLRIIRSILDEYEKKLINFINDNF